MEEGFVVDLLSVLIKKRKEGEVRRVRGIKKNAEESQSSPSVLTASTFFFRADFFLCAVFFMERDLLKWFCVCVNCLGILRVNLLL